MFYPMQLAIWYDNSYIIIIGHASITNVIVTKHFCYIRTLHSAGVAETSFGRSGQIPYSLKISRVKIFVDFGVPTKILALKILSYSIIQCNTSAIHENFNPQKF